MFWNAIAELDLSIGLLMLILFGLLSLRHGHGITMGDTIGGTHVSLPHIRFLCQCWLIALTPLEVQDYALCLLTVVLLQSFHSFEALLFLLLAYIGQLYMIWFAGLVSIRDIVDDSTILLVMLALTTYRYCTKLRFTSSLVLQCCIVIAGVLLCITLIPECYADSIDLENPVNRTSVHWTEYSHMIPATYLGRMVAQPCDMSQLNVPGSFLNQFVTGLLLGDAGFEQANRSGSSYTLKLVLGVNERSMVFACMAAAVFEHYGIGNGLVRCYVYGRKKTLRVYSSYLIEFAPWLKYWTPNNKVIPQSISKSFGDICLLLLVIGDGCWSPSGLAISTLSFTKAGNLRIKAALLNCFGIVANLRENNELYITSSSMPILRGLLRKLCPQCWLYKLYNFSPNGPFRLDLINSPKSQAYIKSSKYNQARCSRRTGKPV